MNVYQCTQCGSLKWMLATDRTVVCCGCKKTPPSIRLQFVPVEPSAVTTAEAKL